MVPGSTNCHRLVNRSVVDSLGSQEYSSNAFCVFIFVFIFSVVHSLSLVIVSLFLHL